MTEHKDQNGELRGFANLQILIILTYTFRAVMANYEQHGFRLFEEVSNFIESRVYHDKKNYFTLVGMFLLILFPIMSFAIEKLATTGFNRVILYFLIVSNMLLLLIYPIFVSFQVESPPLLAMYMTMVSTALLLKLISFHHVYHDNRILKRRFDKLGKTKDGADFNLFNLPKEVYEEAIKYPNNLTLSHFVSYLISPTCCYQLIYPRWGKRRISFILIRLIEFILANVGIVYLYYQYIIPVCQESTVHFKEHNYFMVLQNTLKISIPAAYLWLLFFYSFFHSYLNFFAELTQFGDRRFYEDWWNAKNLQEYWRKWNHPIHNFLIRHIYYTFRRRKISKSLCLLLTFLISAAAHEYLIIGVFRVCNMIAFTIMIINVPLMILQAKLRKIFSPNVNNISFWFGYLIIGQPFGILFCYYQFNLK